jgi:hypothetical protein
MNGPVSAGCVVVLGGGALELPDEETLQDVRNRSAPTRRRLVVRPTVKGYTRQ